jgi:hypothetical protein
MKTYLLVLLTLFSLSECHATWLEFDCTGGLAWHSIPTTNFSIVAGDKTSSILSCIGSVKCLVKVLNKGLYAGVSGDIHNISIRKALTWGTAEPGSYTVTTFAKPAIPLSFELKQYIFSKGGFSLAAGTDIGLVFVIGDGVNSTAFPVYVSHATHQIYAYNDEFGSGFGYCVGLNMAMAVDIDDNIAFEFSVAPRYYDVKGKKYDLIYYGTGLKAERRAYQTYVVPCMIGFRIRL